VADAVRIVEIMFYDQQWIKELGIFSLKREDQEEIREFF
jgi:hypothetical protein